MDPYSAAIEKDLDVPSSASAESVSTFSCSLCDFRSPFTYFGRNPPSASSRLALLEDAYVIKNPFVDPRQAEKTATGKPVQPVLILGSHCSVCQAPVCASVECSYFYATRFCKDCFLKFSRHFPDQARKEFAKNTASKID